MVGNFIADHVKGKEFLNFEEEIQSGILLHRRIDTFTDSHLVVEASKKRLHPHFHKYSPVIVDMFYDHFLAKQWENYSAISLQEFSEKVYSVLEKHQSVFPERTQQMLFYMKKENWLLGYKYVEGINIALTGMSHRTRFKSNFENAASFLKRDYESYKNEFITFFPELKNYCESSY